MQITNHSLSRPYSARAKVLLGAGILLGWAFALLAGGCTSTPGTPFYSSAAASNTMAASGATAASNVTAASDAMSDSDIMGDSDATAASDTMAASVATTTSDPAASSATTTSTTSTNYIIGPGDTLQIFVWRNPDVSATIPVRPDGKISTPLVEDMQAVGKTPTQLARDIEKALGTYLKNPVATVTVTEFVGTFNEQIRVVGQAAEPQALTYRDDLTLLDVIIEVGGLSEFASGNGAKLVRRTSDGIETFNVRLEDLLNKGDMSANVNMQPGDIVVIPESWF